jgi:hypothetical protein
MPNLSITSGRVGTDGIKSYVLQGRAIVVTGTKDAGAVVTVALVPGGAGVVAEEDPADPQKWSIRLPVLTPGQYAVEASTTMPNIKNVRESIDVGRS